MRMLDFLTAILLIAMLALFVEVGILLYNFIKLIRKDL